MNIEHEGSADKKQTLFLLVLALPKILGISEAFLNIFLSFIH